MPWTLTTGHQVAASSGPVAPFRVPPGHRYTRHTKPQTSLLGFRKEPRTSTVTLEARKLRMTTTAAAAQELKTTKITFQNKSGEKLVGTLLDAGSSHVVVLCHGYMAHKDGFHFPKIAEALGEKGICSLRFDFAGNGESEGTFDFCAYAKEVEDIQSAVEFLRSENKQVVALVGHSKGAAEVILYSAKYDDVPRVVNISARFNMVKGITQRFGDTVFDRLRRGGAMEIESKGFTWKLTEESVMERISTDMAAAARSINRTHVLTLHGSADETITVEDAHEYDKLIRGHVLSVVQGANHNYTHRDHAEFMIKELTDFILPAATYLEFR